MQKFLYLISLLFILTYTRAQNSTGKIVFSRADSLRGLLTPLRTCYDVNYYHLDIKVDINQRTVSGSNLIRFTATQDFKKLQIDLFENLEIEKILFKGTELPYQREFNAVFISFPESIKKGDVGQLIVHYSGKPIAAKNAPWDGGFIYSKDSSGKPWIGVACQELGASAWWPTKDHQSDEPDSMLISVAVPQGLMNVSNGRLRSVKALQDGYTQYNWFVSSPINNYGVTLNIGDYIKIEDSFPGKKGNLSIEYYVLRANEAKAKAHFPVDVKNMLKSFEHWFGPYPFYKDGYKLVETSYLGMEHQSAVAYGNRYLKGYRGKDLSGTGLGLSWDYIIIHESGHEWFGNHITSKDIADMWIHEAFTTYSEGLFVESIKGKAAGAEYIKGLRKNIQNQSPIIGQYHVNNPGSGDMYFKGANMLHTIRTIVNNDTKWLKILRGLNTTFGLTTTNTEAVVNYINKSVGQNLTKVFDQYLRFLNIPVLELKQAGKYTEYRWQADILEFEMPVKVRIGEKKWKFLNASTSWKKIKSNSIVADTTNFYIKAKYLP